MRLYCLIYNTHILTKLRLRSKEKSILTERNQRGSLSYMDKKVLFPALGGLLILGVGIGYYSFKSSAPKAENNSVLSSQSSQSEIAPSGQNVVTITADGFSPRVMTIKKGETVTWTNKDSNPHTVNSDPHPTHELYPILNTVGLIDAGQSKSLTFADPGTYTYHDHLEASLTGEVIVITTP